MTDSNNAFTQTTNQLGATDINAIAKLAHLQITDEECQRYAASLNHILSMMDHLQTVDTTGIEPLKNPFDNAQPLRDDVPSEPNRREAYQAVAPATQDGLYLVPKVLD
jgi:aspartyl-tRNA(Asn)/glutamyl-tRNA(Gln) amidotransferase subunit C